MTGAWYTIACGSSGSHTASLTGGPMTFTLDPDADFVPNESCTVTVVAANVTDQDTDDPPDTMTANYVFSFTTSRRRWASTPSRARPHLAATTARSCA